MYTFAQSWQKAALIQQTQQLIKPHSYKNQAMTMTMTPLTHGIAATSTNPRMMPTVHITLSTHGIHEPQRVNKFK